MKQLARISNQVTVSGFILCLLANSLQAAPWDNGIVKVSTDKRCLVHENGKPFFMLGDTVWAMVVRLGREDVVLFLNNRKAKGFNAFLPVLHTPFFAEPNPKTVYGHRMFEGDARNPDLTRPRVVHGGGPDNPNDFWDHIDFIVREAEKRGIYVGFLPVWGNSLVSNKKSYTNGIARAYGEFVGRRYQGAPNIFWVLGGDCVPFADRSVDGADQRPVYRAMAEGIVKGVTGESPAWNKAHAAWDKVLMTFHHSPTGKAEQALWWGQDAWHDFYMFQSAHGSYDLRSDQSFVAPLYNASARKPVLDGEPCYEHHGLRQYNMTGPIFDDYDIRQRAYFSTLAGSIGHVYGNANVWHFEDPHDNLQGKWTTKIVHWKQDMDSKGSFHMTHLKTLWDSRSLAGRMPAKDILAKPLSGARQLVAIKGKGYAMVYAPFGDNISVKLGRLGFKEKKCWWYNPRDGKAELIKTTASNGNETFNPPGDAVRKNDWLLVIDDVAKGWGAPGTVATP